MGANILDQLMAREGAIDPDFAGIHQAKAADLVWDRERGETEQKFIARVLVEAAAAGFRVVAICGALEVNPAPPDIA